MKTKQCNLNEYPLNEASDETGALFCANLACYLPAPRFTLHLFLIKGFSFTQQLTGSGCLGSI